MAESILTLRELNRATLARQLLLERASISAFAALKCLVGLQAQVPKPPYIGLWTRLLPFQHADLTHLLENKQAVRATMMRSTLHLIATEDYMLLRPALQPALTRALHGFFSKSAKSVNVDQFATAMQTYVQEQPRTFVEMRAKLMELFPDTDPALMAYTVRTHLPLVQIPPGGTWSFTGSPAHAIAETWLDRPFADSSESLRALILRYLAAFGPATVQDIQAWSGLTRLQSAVEALKPELCTFRDEQGNQLFDLPDSPRLSADMPAPLRFIPEFDNLVLSHADRRRIVRNEYRPLFIVPPGRVLATFLVDGFVCGTWKTERTHNVARLIITTFEPLSNNVYDELVEEGERLLRFVEDSAERYEVEVV